MDWLRANPQQDDATTARILHAYGRLLWINNRFVEALGPVEEAVKLRRSLEGISSDGAADLAASLRLVAPLYAATGRSKEVLPPILEAVAMHRRLAERDTGLRGELALSLNVLGLIYSALDRPAAALPPTVEAVKIRRSLAFKDPEEMANLADALNDLGNRYGELADSRTRSLPTCKQWTTSEGWLPPILPPSAFWRTPSATWSGSIANSGAPPRPCSTA